MEKKCDMYNFDMKIMALKYFGIEDWMVKSLTGKIWEGKFVAWQDFAGEKSWHSEIWQVCAGKVSCGKVWR